MDSDDSNLADAHDYYSDKTATFGDRLADARGALDMTQKELAHRIGVRTETLDNWENDLSEPRASRLNILAGLLNVSLRWLMTGEGEGLPNPLDGGGHSTENKRILVEMRQLQRDMVACADRLGMLEKRLRLSDSAE